MEPQQEEEVFNKVSTGRLSSALLTRNVFARLQVADSQVIDLLRSVRLCDDQQKIRFHSALPPAQLTSALLTAHNLWKGKFPGRERERERERGEVIANNRLT